MFAVISYCEEILSFFSNELRTMVEIAFGLKIHSVSPRVIGEMREDNLDYYLCLCNDTNI